MNKKFKFWCKGTSINTNFNKPGWWTFPNYLLQKHYKGLSIFESPDFEVVQYTGVKDRNNVEIYEGDIIQWWWNTEEDGQPGLGSGGYSLSKHKYIVELKNGIFGFNIGRGEFRPIYSELCEIVGNKFETSII